jgi:hypothetical protein
MDSEHPWASRRKCWIRARITSQYAGALTYASRSCPYHSRLAERRLLRRPWRLPLELAGCLEELCHVPVERKWSITHVRQPTRPGLTSCSRRRHRPYARLASPSRSAQSRRTPLLHLSRPVWQTISVLRSMRATRPPDAVLPSLPPSRRNCSLALVAQSGLVMLKTRGRRRAMVDSCCYLGGHVAARDKEASSCCFGRVSGMMY